MQSSQTFTPTSLKWRTRASQAILSKIEKTYHLTPGLSAQAEEIVAPKIEQTLAMNDKWLATRDEAIRLSPKASTISIEAVELTARQIVRRYVEAYHTREKLLDTPHQSAEFYRRDDTKKRLIDVYINHRCNEAELELQSLGLSPESAHVMNGSLIRVSMIAYRAYNPDETISHVAPGIGSVRGTPAVGSCVPAKKPSIPERIDTVRNYWRLKAFDINQSHGRFLAATRR
jgi:hypothetical protein